MHDVYKTLQTHPLTEVRHVCFTQPVLSLARPNFLAIIETRFQASLLAPPALILTCNRCAAMKSYESLTAQQAWIWQSLCMDLYNGKQVQCEEK